MSTVERLNKFFHPCFLPITFFLLRVYTSIRPSTCLPLKCLRAGSACLPPTRSVCVPCALFVDSAAATPCIRTSPAESFSRPEVFCSGIDLIAPVCLQSGASKPHRNWQTRQNCSARHTSRSQTGCAQRRVWSGEQTPAQTRCSNRRNPYTAKVIHTLDKMPLRCVPTGAVLQLHLYRRAHHDDSTLCFCFPRFDKKE